MTDEPKTNEPKTDPKPDDPPAAEVEEKLVPAHRVDAIAAEAARWKQQALEHQKLIDEINAAKAKEEEERLRKAQDFEAIEAKHKERAAQLERELADERTQRTRDKIELALANAGFRDEHGIVRKGLLADRMEAESPLEDLDKWTAALSEQYPSHFGQVTTSPTTRAGSPDHGAPAGGDLDSRLASKDLAVRSAAIREARQLRQEGRR